MAVDWVGVGLGALASLVVGVVLWLVLPRGAALMKSGRVVAPDTWEVANTSPVPVRITRVTRGGYDTPVEGAELSVNDHGELVRLSFNDEVLDTRRTDHERPWSGQIVPPGETLTAYVGVNRWVRIDYRRAGRFGVFERRSLTIFGFA